MRGLKNRHCALCLNPLGDSRKDKIFCDSCRRRVSDIRHGKSFVICVQNRLIHYDKARQEVTIISRLKDNTT